MKLIIDISDEAYNVLLTEQVLPSHIDVEWLLIHGIPLDDVKAEIANINTFERAGCWVMEDVFKVLDNIGKAESEDKE